MQENFNPNPVDKPESNKESFDEISEEILELCLSQKEIKEQKKMCIEELKVFLENVDPENYFTPEFEDLQRAYHVEEQTYPVVSFSSYFTVVVNGIKHRVGWLHDTNEFVDYIIGYAEKIGRKDLKIDYAKGYDEVLIKLQTVPIEKDLLDKLRQLENSEYKRNEKNDWPTWDYWTELTKENVVSDASIYGEKGIRGRDQILWARDKILRGDQSDSLPNVGGYSKLK